MQDEQLLREFIRHELAEARTNKASKESIQLARVGGLSPVKQNSAPGRRGIWAFIWPNIELFLIGSTDSEGATTGTSRPSRGEQLQKKIEKLRKFTYTGFLWTYLPDAARYAVEQKGDWSLIHSSDLVKIARQYEHQLRKWTRADDPNLPPGYKRSYSKDEWEVFIPANKGKIS